MPSPQIQNLAALMREKKRRGDRFVVMLGAGASMGSGVRSTPAIMEELLAKYGRELTEGPLEARFDELWERTNDREREMYLEPYLDVLPSKGYQRLAALIEQDYIDLVLTFNFDDLLEKALRTAGFDDFHVIRRGETAEDRMAALLEARKPRFKIFKLHGSVRGSRDFLFSPAEMLTYPPTIENLVRSATSRDIIVVGYAFEDQCVARAFAITGGSVVSVNPGGVPRGLRGYQNARRSRHLDIWATFDDFFEELWQELTQPAAGEEPARPVVNPFKFLESYEESDREWLMEREEETGTFMQAIAGATPPRVIVLAGSARVGKTSLVRASLIPSLEQAGHRAVYLRCRRRDFATMLNQDLANLGLIPADTAADASLSTLALTGNDRHTVLFLDQFDRLTNQKDVAGVPVFPWRTREGSRKLEAFLYERLLRYTGERLTLVLVITDEGGLGGALLQACGRRHVPAYPVQCFALERPQVVRIINDLARAAGIEFDPRIIEQLAIRYEQHNDSGEANTRFTLAHVQAVCHLLARSARVDYASYEPIEDNFEALHQAINVCDIINFVEDFSWPESVWLRNIIKVPLRKRKEQIADFIIQHYDELLPSSNRAPPSPPDSIPEILQPV